MNKTFQLSLFGLSLTIIDFKYKLFIRSNRPVSIDLQHKIFNYLASEGFINDTEFSENC